MKLRMILIVGSVMFFLGCGDDSSVNSNNATASNDTADALTSDAVVDLQEHHDIDADIASSSDIEPTPDVAIDTAMGTDAVDVGGETDVLISDSEGLTAIGTGVFLLDVDSEALNVASATARFVEFTPLPEIPEETFPCTVGWVDPDSENPLEFGYDSGTVTVSGLLQEVTLTPTTLPNTGTGYESGLADDLDDLLPAGGALMTISATGGTDIGAWSGVLQAPEPVTISKPSMGFGSSHSVAKDLFVTWNAGTGNTVVVSISPLGPLFQAQEGNVVTCWFTEDNGEGLVPGSLMAQVLNGKGSQNTAIGVTRIKTDTTENGLHSIPLTAARASGGLLSLKP